MEVKWNPVSRFHTCASTSAGQEQRRRERTCGHRSREWDGLRGCLSGCSPPRLRPTARGPAHSAGSREGCPGSPRWVGCARVGQVRREGICVHRQLIHVATQRKPTPHCQAITLQFKKCNKKQK